MVIGRERGLPTAKIVFLLPKTMATEEREAVMRGFRHAKGVVGQGILRWRFSACILDGGQPIQRQSEALCVAIREIGLGTTPRSLQSNILLLGAKLTYHMKQEGALKLAKLSGPVH